MRQMLQVLCSVAVCMRGHNSPASSNEEGGNDSSCDDYELDDNWFSVMLTSPLQL